MAARPPPRFRRRRVLVSGRGSPAPWRLAACALALGKATGRNRYRSGCWRPLLRRWRTPTPICWGSTRAASDTASAYGSRGCQQYGGASGIGVCASSAARRSSSYRTQRASCTRAPFGATIDRPATWRLQFARNWSKWFARASRSKCRCARPGRSSASALLSPRKGRWSSGLIRMVPLRKSECCSMERTELT